ncbi:HEAT repeat domain-containing protein [Bacillus badius]|uniref:HEAT repeat domain-containing protein n=1 Tax=Bacillus badius TaxID=1455 RepID=A0ABR5AQW8_BACBA|nr:hypothetical protein [Bacillus badius]KIL72642.1 hypothetical protein SD78_4227 [Bacillus badius]KIL77142.1 hypothetical protein SD77_1747 [Bacillus badius]KZR59468.1 hypothetical protein A3781_12910 [Bacillus badius]MED4716725.1 hypothetical protein [Bacillus badius]
MSDTMKVIIYINLILLGILLFLLVFLIVQKVITNKRTERVEQIKDYLRPDLFAYLLGTEEEIHNRWLNNDPLSIQALEELLEEAASILKGEMAGETITLLAEEWLKEEYHRRLAKGRWSTRMNVLYRIENFYMSSFSHHLWLALAENALRTEAERTEAIRVLASLQSNALARDLISLDPPLSKAVYKDVLRRFNDTYDAGFIENYEKLNNVFKQAIIEWVAETQEYSYLPFVVEQLKQPHLELRIAALKVLYLFGYTADSADVYPFSYSQYWQERMMFAKLAGAAKKDGFLPQLTKLIADENWFVRNAAGEALQQYANGTLILQHIIETHHDRYAKDMAAQWLESEGVRIG